MSAYVVLTAFLFQKGSAESSDPDALAAALPEGANVYFDNVAGAISDRVYPHLATGARVVVCGTAPLERWAPWPQGQRVARHPLVQRARLAGLALFAHLDR